MSYDPDTKTLTLNGATISGGYSNVALYAYDDLTINVTSDSTVTGPNMSGSYGIYVYNGSLTITGSGKLDATGGSVTDIYGYSIGVRAEGSVTVNGELTATGGAAPYSRSDSYGVYTSSSVTVNGTLNATGGNASDYSYGVCAW